MPWLLLAFAAGLVVGVFLGVKVGVFARLLGGGGVRGMGPKNHAAFSRAEVIALQHEAAEVASRARDAAARMMEE
jgi:hypothetical protein